MGKKYSFIVVNYSKTYFVRHHSDSTNMYYIATKLKKAMLECPIDNYFVVLVNQIFQRSVGISMGTNFAPCYRYDGDFVQNFLHEKKTLSVTFNLTFRYVDDVLSIDTIIFIHMSIQYITIN